MIFIYNVFFVSVFGKIFGKKIHRQKYKKLYLTICFFQMFLIQALRASYVGSDTIQYIDIYNKFSTNSIYAYRLTHYEIGIQFLIKILYSLGLNVQFLLACMSAIIMLGFAIYIYQNSENVILSTFLFATLFYVNSFNVSRQYVAMAIALNSFYFIYRNQYLRGIILVLFSSLFHSSVILLLIPFIFAMIKSTNLTKKMLVIFNLFVLIFGSYLTTKILGYIHNSYYISTEYVKNDIFSLTTFLSFMYAIIFYYGSKKCYDYNDKRILNIYTCIALSNLSFGILYLKNEIFSRFIELLNSHLVISVPFLESKTHNKYSQIIYIFFIIMPIMWMILMVYNSGAGVSEYGLFFLE